MRQPAALGHLCRARARDAGLTDADIRRVAQGPEAPAWDADDRLLLRLADQLYLNSSVTDAAWSALATRYDEHYLMDAVETVNHFTVLSLIYNSFGVQPDTETTDRLPADVEYEIAVPDREPRLTVARLEPLPGTGIAISRTFARHPDLAQPRGPWAGYVNRVSPLQPRDREILILRIGWNCQAEYEWAKHVGTVGRARDHGVNPVAVAAGPDAPGASGADVTLLRVVDELYQDAMVSDATWGRADGPRWAGRGDECRLHAKLVSGDIDVAQCLRRSARRRRRGFSRSCLGNELSMGSVPDSGQCPGVGLIAS